MAKIAAVLETALEQRDRLGEIGHTQARVLARGAGWRVADVVCTCGPQDRRYEEQHREHAVAFVVAGMFEQRSTDGRAVMTPGATMLGNPGGCFECSHTHARGDRCVSFWYSEEYFDRMLRDLGQRGVSDRFAVAALPPLAATATLVIRVARAATANDAVEWDELAARAAAETLRLTYRTPWTPTSISRRAESRVADAIQLIEAAPENAPSLEQLARRADMSPYHFLRVFSSVSGLTPHQYKRRARLRRAGARLLAERTPIIDIAFESGFGDVSNFNHAFREEFGTAPRRFRQKG